ncbi:MAG: hypothetical protein ACI4MJ_11080 [Aristaeellaceae bacterium]
MPMEQARQAFLHPGDAYSPLPFWFWNDELTEAELSRQIHDFHDKGVAGFVIHPRKGLPRSIPYLSERYLHFVRFAVEEAAALHMRVVLYDEAMYPSGSAHGMVVRENPSYASRCLRMDVITAQAIPVTADILAVCAAQVAGGRVSDVEALTPVMGIYPAPADGRVLLCFREGYSGGTIRGVHEGEDDGEPDAPPSADLLNPSAVQAFIRLTHEVYWQAVGEHFGKTIIAMFTDEPDITGRNAAPGCRAWTPGFLADFLAQGCAVTDLPALWLDAGADTARVRQLYRRAVNHRMRASYYGQLSAWCQAHGIALTGHPAKGWDMGLLRDFQLPGQDVVWRFVGPGQGIHGPESVLAKCASDAARHLGRARNANECFGCCGPDGNQWAFSMDDMKWYMDWLFVRGTNLLYPHAFFYSLRDGRGDERPPDVGPGNLWWPWYGQIAQYMRRMCWLMTGGVNQARVAVLCQEDCLPWEVCVPLYEHQVEFNYLMDTDLSACRVENGMVCLGQQRYALVITQEVAMSAEAQAALGLQPCLLAVTSAGLRVLDGAETPDAAPAGCERIHALRPMGSTPAELRTIGGHTPAALRTSWVKKDGLDFFLLVNEGEEDIRCMITLPVRGAAQWWDAWTGRTEDALTDGQGQYALTLPRRGSLVLCVDTAGEPMLADTPREAFAPPELRNLRPLHGQTWRVTLPGQDSPALTVVTSPDGHLPTRQELPSLTHEKGWAVYETDIVLTEDCLLDAGEGHAMSRLTLDGQEAGMHMWPPHRYVIPAGMHTLRLFLCGTLGG